MTVIHAYPTRRPDLPGVWGLVPTEDGFLPYLRRHFGEEDLYVTAAADAALLGNPLTGGRSAHPVVVAGVPGWAWVPRRGYVLCWDRLGVPPPLGEEFT